jgi:probable phosphoglycerate mutase
MMIPRDAARLVLIRHGEASGNRELVYLGSTDASLTPLGEEQAREVARSPLVAGCAAVYTSPLLRARDTARAIADALNVEPVLSDDLREMDFGAWELLTRLQARERDAALLAAWEPGEYLRGGLVAPSPFSSRHPACLQLDGASG